MSPDPGSACVRARVRDCGREQVGPFWFGAEEKLNLLRSKKWLFSCGLFTLLRLNLAHCCVVGLTFQGSLCVLIWPVKPFQDISLLAFGATQLPVDFSLNLT